MFYCQELQADHLLVTTHSIWFADSQCSHADYNNILVAVLDVFRLQTLKTSLPDNDFRVIFL